MVVHVALGWPGQVEQEAEAARLLQRGGDVAVAHYARRLRLHPRDATAWHTLARVYSGLERFDESLDAYHRAVAISPSHAEGALQGHLGNAYQRQKRADEALVAYRRAVRVAPDNDKFWNQAGAALLSTTCTG